MATQVQDLAQRFYWDFLEDDGLVLGVLTTQQFLDYLSEAVVEFCQQAGLVKSVFTQTILLGQAQYLIPEEQYVLQAAFVGGVYLNPTTLEELYNTEYEWPKQSGQPLQWFQDGMAESQLQLVPIPDFNGTLVPAPQPPFGAFGSFSAADRNLTTVGTAGPNPIALTLDDAIPSVVPDSFTPYLIYRVHWRVASMDGEAKDLQRARYCEARWNEGISLARAIMMQAYNDEK